MTFRGSGRVGDITWRQILSQHSGLQREAPCDFDDCDLSTAKVLSMLSEIPLQAVPWTQAIYSNFGFALAGHLVAERVFKKNSFEEALSEQILDKLGLANTGLDIANAFKPGNNAAFAYVPGTSTILPRSLESLKWIGPAGEMVKKKKKKKKRQKRNKKGLYFVSKNSSEFVALFVWF